ncbi:hypothetical protein [uncultured Bilophila sp.]|uniref:hypothetical protein n=1 Tax=uncultured Bilophila sp. TaxID=529385 RepID=UPI00280B4AE4|nr:hypothetical protein [uncultured Bilophila sp.]
MNKMAAAIWRLARSLGEEPFSEVYLFQVMRASAREKRDAIRANLRMLILRGDIEACGDRLYRAIERRLKDAESYGRLWRIARIQSPGWTMQNVAAIARVSDETAERYIKWLVDSDYVERAGLHKGIVLWRVTKKGREERIPPLPDTDIPEPYVEEMKAAATLCGLMMVSDLSQPYVQDGIRDQLSVLNKRFFTQVENFTEYKGESHV